MEIYREIIRTAEVDFVIQEGLEVIPVEVKASSNTAGKSLSVYIGKYNPTIAIILSSKDLSVTIDKKRNVKVLNMPLPLIDWLPQILRMIP